MNDLFDTCYCDDDLHLEHSNAFIGNNYQDCCLESLFEKGYDPNALDQDGETFMHSICSESQLQIALRYGGDINVRNKHDLIPLYSGLIEHERLDYIFVVCPEKIQLLLRYGADVYIQIALDSSKPKWMTLLEFIDYQIDRYQSESCSCEYDVDDDGFQSLDYCCNACMNSSAYEEIRSMVMNLKKTKTLFELMLNYIDFGDKKRRFQ